MKILLNETETAKQLSLKTSTLRKWRCHGKGPSFVKFGSAVRYEQAAIIAFINDNIKQSTSEV
jgi:predicted DNA-binding transcriptional regulator AlpA